MEDFSRKLSEFKTAVSSFSSAYQQNSHRVFSCVNSIASMIREIESVWNSYSSSRDMDSAKRFHVKIRAKFEMVKRSFLEAENATSSDSGRKKYGDNLNYLKTKMEEMKNAFPLSPSYVESVQSFLDFGVECVPEVNEQVHSNEENKESEAEGAEDEEKKIASSSESEFMKRLYELKDAVSGFQSRYKESRGLSHVEYISDILIYIKCIEDAWGCYWRNVDCSAIKNSYDNIIRMMGDILKYAKMSEIIAKYNGVSEEFFENQRYIIVKANNLSESFPKIVHSPEEAKEVFGVKNLFNEKWNEEEEIKPIKRRKK